MERKTLSLFVGTILTLVLLLSFASAAISFTTTPELSRTGTSVGITLQSTVDEVVTFSGLTSITESGDTITFTTPSSVTLFAGVPQNITVYYSVPSGFDFLLGKSYSTTLTATGTVSTVASHTLTFGVKEYCDYSNPGSLDISDVEFTNQGKFGEDDEWYPLTEVQVDFVVENNGDEDVKSIEVKWALYSDEGKLIIDGKESKFNLNNDDEQDMTFTIKIDENIDELTDGSYKFYIKATGTEQGNDDKTCVSTDESVNVVLESDFVVLDNFEYPETVSCDSELYITADVWNIGEDDQSDISVRVYNSELKIDKTITVGDLDAFEDTKLEVTLELPEDVSSKTYAFEFSVLDDNGDIYQNDNDDDSVFTLPIKIEGGCNVAKAIVSGEIVSGGKAGQDLVVKAKITNSGTKTASYTINALGFADWADTAELDQKTISVDAGQTKEVTITFDTKKVDTGDYSFDLELLSGGSIVVKQPFEVSLEKSSFFGGFSLGDNWYLWLIGALNVLLIIIIIVVAVKVASK